MRKGLLLGVLWIGGSHLFAVQLEFAPRVFALYESGPVTTAATPGLGVEFGLIQTLGIGEMYTRIGLFSGAFIGEGFGFKAALGYYFRIGPHWHPGIGLGYTLDAGSRLISGFSYDGIPESPMAYLGLKIEIFRFITENYTLSWLGSEISLALCEGPPIIRAEMDLFRLGYTWAPPQPKHKLVDTVPVSKTTPIPSLQSNWIGLSAGYDFTLLGFGLYALRPLSLEASINSRALELSVSYILLGTQIEKWNKAWLFSVSVLFAPNIGYWNPAIGIGFLYANPDYMINGAVMSQVIKGDFSTFHLTIKPLRFHIPLGDKLRLSLSFAELRYGSLLPTFIQPSGSTGSLAIVSSLVRVGIGMKLY